MIIMDFFRKHLRKKNKNSIEEQNAQNEKKWKELEISSDPRNRKEGNPDFAKRKFDFNEGMEQVLEVEYEKEREVGVKLFFSNDELTAFSRNYKERVNDNFIRFTIQVARKSNAKLISGGNFDFGDDFDGGYTLSVLFKYNDKKLISDVSKILRSKKFGCLPTNFSIHAHLNDKNPTDGTAKEILSQITDELSSHIEHGNSYRNDNTL